MRTNLHRTLPAGFCPLVAVGVYERQSLIVFDKIVENEKSARGKTTRLHRHTENTKDGLMSCNVFCVSLSRWNHGRRGSTLVDHFFMLFQTLPRPIL